MFSLLFAGRSERKRPIFNTLMRKPFDELTKDELWELRQDIVLNSLFYSDYENYMGYDCHPVCDFFDGYVEYLVELAEENGFDWHDNASLLFDAYDNKANLWDWRLMNEDLSWVTLLPETPVLSLVEHDEAV